MDKAWFYAVKGQEKQGPIATDEIRKLLSDGALTPADLVWCEGMTDWTALGNVPDFQSPSATVTPTATAYVLPSGLLGWMSFVGVFSIIWGAMSCLTCVGIFTGILMIIAGTALLGCRTALSTVASLDASLAPFFQKFKTFMMMSGFIFIISIVGMIIMGIIYFGVIAAMIAGFASNMN